MPVGGPHFSSVRKAREALLARANELLDDYIKLIKQAAEAGDYDVASKSYQYLLDHIPPDEDGQRLLEVSIDKPKQIEAKTGPTINIGFALGGMPKAKELPAPVIEAETLEPVDE